MNVIRNNVSIFACGGCGINIVGTLPDSTSDAKAIATCYAIDTSKSNLHDSKFSSDNLYLFEGIDGSGKVRSENHEVIAKNTLQILQKFQPGAFNIVVHSGGGGSGNVIAGSLVSELARQGEQVVVIMIGSTNSQIEVENTHKTLKSYEVIAQRAGCPIIVHYLENGVNASRKTIDGGAHAAIQALLMLFSGLNAEMDSADLRNWVAHAGAKEVFSLQFCPTTEAYARAGTVISVATLAREDHNVALDPSPAYQTVGYVVNKDAVEAIVDPLHFTLSGNLIDTCAKLLNSMKQANDKRFKSAIRRDSLTEKGDKVTDYGIVL